MFITKYDYNKIWLQKNMIITKYDSKKIWL